jgi:hypothetical protein
LRILTFSTTPTLRNLATKAWPASCTAVTMAGGARATYITSGSDHAVSDGCRFRLCETRSLKAIQT